MNDVLDIDFPVIDASARELAEARQSRLTKPSGSLGQLERVVLDLAGWQGRSVPESRAAAAILFAADHPVAAHGVSAYPSEVTAAMVTNFLAGGAAASVTARALDIPLTVVDVGVATPYAVPRAPKATLVQAPSTAPVGDLLTEDGLSPPALLDAMRAGREAVDQLPDDTRLLILGEMGIGNTTVAAALAAAVAGGEPASWVGPGSGVQSAALAKKISVVERSIARVGTPGKIAADVALQRLGGREVAALVGAAGRAAARRMTILVDGFIVSAAMMVLVALRPTCRPALLFAHRSAEPAHQAMLAYLGAEPLLDLGLRLGEGSGALTAWPLVDLACRLHAGMATFEEASVPDRAPFDEPALSTGRGATEG